MILFVLCVQNGIEYSADGRVLLRAPDNFNGDIVVPQEVVTIGTSSELVGSPFFKCKDNLRSLSFFPSSQVQNICSFCFSESSLESVDMQYCTLLTVLNNSVFKLCNKLQTITLPPNIVEIKSGCFNSASLTSISIPDSLEIIGDWSSKDGGVFAKCVSSISINPSSNLKKFGGDAFADSKFTSIYIPKNVTIMSASCFVNVPLETIGIHPENNNFKIDGLSIFSGINNNTLVYVSKQFTGEYIVPSFVTKIGNQAFRNGQITRVIIHSEVTSIGSWCFGASNLVNIVLPEKVVILASSIFYNCLKLQSVKFSSSLTNISASAFYGCSSLTSIVFPPTLVGIGESAFYGCTNIDIDSSQNTNFYYGNQMLLTNQKTTISEFFGDDSNLEITAPVGTTTIGSRTFMSKHLKTIQFQGNTLTRVGDSCFASSTLQSISFPDSL
ncbi:ribonuclease inhibitor domain-containing protein, partial [Trichomonas vaginalis G3]|uniref:ribonuclease inhibitor domain-containing protein n=1 Tax=Trichomonas vaginalis (strain ATCC PRA-98 / G3) TaxID=412133 RepID=UPI0021E61ADC